MKIGEAIEWGLFDIATMMVIIFSIRFIYQQRYETTAYLYLKTQLELFISHCITCMASLYIYYFLENKFNVDEQYTGGNNIDVLFPGIRSGRKLFLQNLFS